MHEPATLPDDATLDDATLEDHGGWPALLTELVEHRDLSAAQARRLAPDAAL